MAVSVAGLTLALAGCTGDEVPDEARDVPASGAVVLDRPWVFVFSVENENEWVDTYCYLRITPATGESATYQVPWNLDDSSHPGTYLDAAGEWAIEGNAILEDPATVHSLTGREDLTLDLTKFTPRPTAWAFVPDRAGHAGTGMPVAVDELWNGDDGRYRPHGITPIHVAGGVYGESASPDVDNAWPYGFKDRAGQSWKLGSDEDTDAIVIRRLQDKKWKQVARATGACGSIEYVLPAAE